MSVGDCHCRAEASGWGQGRAGNQCALCPTLREGEIPSAAGSGPLRAVLGKQKAALGQPCFALRPGPRRCLWRPSAAFPGAGPCELAALTEGGPTARRQSGGDRAVSALQTSCLQHWDFENRTHFRTCGIGYFYFCVVSFRACRAFYLHESAAVVTPAAGLREAPFFLGKPHIDPVV